MESGAAAAAQGVGVRVISFTFIIFPHLLSSDSGRHNLERARRDDVARATDPRRDATPHRARVLGDFIVLSSPSNPDAAEPVDVCIVGGGIVGTALACSIRANPLTAHLTVSLADRAPPPASAWLDDPPPTPEPRVSALTPASVALLRDVGAWDRVEASRRACAFRAMQVWDAESVGHVRYDASEVGATELGHVVENRVVHTALHEAATRLGVRTSPPAAAVALDLPADGGGDLATIKFRREGGDGDGDEDGSPEIAEVRARLVVGADGPSSKVRTLAGLRAAGWRYGLKAAVGTVTTDEPHVTAWQRFLPSGPLALLPVTEDGRVSNVVWTTTPEEADRLCALGDEAFAAEVDAALRGEGRHSHGGQGEVGSGEGRRRRPGFVYGFEGQWLMGEAQERLVDVLLKPATEAAIRAVANGFGGTAGGDDAPPPFEHPPRVVAAAGPRARSRSPRPSRGGTRSAGWRSWATPRTRCTRWVGKA